MPRKASGNFNQVDYVKSYVKENIIIKKVFFNKKNEQDMLDWIKNRNFSGYIKWLIRSDMGEMHNLSDEDYLFSRTPRQLAKENTLRDLRWQAGWIDAESLGNIYGDWGLPDDFFDEIVSTERCEKIIAEWHSEKPAPSVKDVRRAFQILTALYIAENEEE